MVHIEIHGDRASVIEVSGSCDTVAGELAAAVGVIYSNLCDSDTEAGSTFRAAITSMLSDRSSVWAESRKVNTGAGASMVIAPPMKPVVHAEWDADGKCTACGKRWDEYMHDNGDDWGYFDPMPPFCLNCGATMDADVREEQK